MTGSRLFAVLLILGVVMMVAPAHGITTTDEPELKSPMNLDETVDVQMASNTRWPPASEIIHNNISYDDNIYGVTQEDASLLYLWKNFKNSSGLGRALIAKEIQDTFTYMALLDKSIDMIRFLLFGPQKARMLIDSVPEPGKPIVDDWGCHKSMVELFEKHCGAVTEYAVRRFGSFAKICDHLVQGAPVEQAFKLAWSTKINIPYGLEM